MRKGFDKFIIVLPVLFFLLKAEAQTRIAELPVIRPTFLPVADSLRPAPSAFSVAKDGYAKHLPFFCRQELKIARLTGVPIRIRAGSLEQCNRLEGKP